MKILTSKLLVNEKTKKIINLVSTMKTKPILYIIWVGENFSSQKYISIKQKKANELGIPTKLIHLSSKTLESELINLIINLNNDNNVNGYLIQLPLPNHINVENIQSVIDPKKDVDGISIKNLGKLFNNSNNYVIPATTKGIASLLKHYNINLGGKVCAVVGRSIIVGKPTSQYLLSKNATIITCHSKTNLNILKTADIIIVAVGQPRLINKDIIKKGVIIIDVGINSLNKKIIGDVDVESIQSIAQAYSPVPGGVGPMTVISLFENLLELYGFKI